MPIDRTKCLAGPAIVLIDGEDWGLTTDDGVEMTLEENSAELTGAQSRGLLDEHRSMQDVTFTFAIQELSLERLKKVFDGSSDVSGGVLSHRVQGTVTRHLLEVLGPGPSGGARRVTATVRLKASGGTKISKDEYQNLEVEARCFIDPTNEQLFTMQDTAASGTAPTVASFQEVTAAGSEGTITDPDTGFAVTSAVQATFSKGIAPSQLTAGRFQLVVADGAAVAATVGYGTTAGATDPTKVKVTPAAALSASTAYKFLIATGIEAIDGTRLAASSHIDLTTA